MRTFLLQVPRWAKIFATALALCGIFFAGLAIVNLISGAGTTEVFFDVVSSAALLFTGWCIVAKGKLRASTDAYAAERPPGPFGW